jgi:hypothetical protein
MKIINLKNMKNNGRLALFLSVLLLVLSSGNGYAQPSGSRQSTVRVTGTVTSSVDGAELPGVSIVIKGTTTGTVTDLDGKYTIDVPENGTLLFSYLGFETQEIAVNGRRSINATLVESAEALDELVVTALGIRREEKSLGYAVGKIDAEELSKVVHENLLTSMAGKVTGITINSTGGTGSTVSMIIRGATSMSTDNQPLFVVDGVPMTSSSFFT